MLRVIRKNDEQAILSCRNSRLTIIHDNNIRPYQYAAKQFIRAEVRPAQPTPIPGQCYLLICIAHKNLQKSEQSAARRLRIIRERMQLNHSSSNMPVCVGYNGPRSLPATRPVERSMSAWATHVGWRHSRRRHSNHAVTIYTIRPRSIDRQSPLITHPPSSVLKDVQNVHNNWRLNCEH